MLSATWAEGKITRRCEIKRVKIFRNNATKTHLSGVDVTNDDDVDMKLVLAHFDTSECQLVNEEGKRVQQKQR